MRIQLLHPPIFFNPRAIQATRPSLPLGLAYVAGALRQAGHDVLVLDAVEQNPKQITVAGAFQYIGLRPDEIVARIDPDAAAIGISTMFSFTWPLVREMIRQIWERYPEKILVGGGEHFTGMADEVLRTSQIDFVVLGEGEETIVELAAALDKGTIVDDVKGIAFLREGEVTRTEKRARIKDVDSLARPAWDLFDPRTYYEQGFVFGVNAGMTIPILATRGCPYACTYCSNDMMWGRNWYARDPGDVADEIETYMQAYGAVNFPFHDLTAILKKEWIVRFCTELLRRELKITWQLPSGTRCESIDDEVAALLRQTGGTSLTFAPESGSARTRQIIGKKMREESLIDAVRACVRERLNVSAFFVVGFPEDTAADLRQSVRLACRLAAAGINDIALSLFFPIPNTRLYNELVASGRLHEGDTALLTPLYAMEPGVDEENNYCRHISAAGLTRYKWQILLAFYATSFLVRPWRIFQLGWNVLRDRETCKLDIFLNGRKRKLLGVLR